MIFLLKHVHSDNKFRIDTYILAVPMGKKREKIKNEVYIAQKMIHI